MPRLRNRSTGGVVNVSAETAARLGSEWVPVEPAKPSSPPVGRSKKSKSAR